MRDESTTWNGRINVEEDYDLRAWSDRFGVDKERVLEAVRSVGGRRVVVIVHEEVPKT